MERSDFRMGRERLLRDWKARARGSDSAPRSARRALGLAVVALLAVSSAGCTWLDNLLASVPTFSFLREAPSFDPYEAPRPMPENAVPFASPNGVAQPPLAATEAALAAFGDAVGPNPVPATPAVLERGQELYTTFCFVCHGPAGRGDGPAILRPGQDEPGSRFPVSRNLLDPITVQRTDGYLYGIIRVGRGLMPPYGDKIGDLERWYVVHYLRQLQQAAGAAPAAAPGGAAGQPR